MNQQRMIELVGTEVTKVAYGSASGRKIAVCNKGEEPATLPKGTVGTQEATILEGITLSDGTQIPGLQSMVIAIGPRTFLRGRLVTDQKEAIALLTSPFLQEIVSQLGELVDVAALGAVPTVVAVIQGDGTEVGIPLEDGDVLPPEGASPYAVGESPLEIAAAVETDAAKRDAEIAELRTFPEHVPSELAEEAYNAGIRVGNCPSCTERHPLKPGTVALTDEEAQAERERRAEADAKADPEWDEDFDDDDEIVTAELIDEADGQQDS